MSAAQQRDGHPGPGPVTAQDQKDSSALSQFLPRRCKVSWAGSVQGTGRRADDLGSQGCDTSLNSPNKMGLGVIGNALPRVYFLGIVL